jgi:hypothetical protein
MLSNGVKQPGAFERWFSQTLPGSCSSAQAGQGLVLRQKHFCQIWFENFVAKSSKIDGVTHSILIFGCP